MAFNSVVGRTVVRVTLVRASLVRAWFLVWSLFLALLAITSSGHDGCDVSMQLTFAYSCNLC